MEKGWLRVRWTTICERRHERWKCLFLRAHTHTHTCGSLERWMGGVRAGCMPPLLKDSERGGREGSEMRLDTLCCSAGELCLFSLDRSSTWGRSHTTVTHSEAHNTTSHHVWSTMGITHTPMHLYKPLDNLKHHSSLRWQQPQCRSVQLMDCWILHKKFTRASLYIAHCFNDMIGLCVTKWSLVFQVKTSLNRLFYAIITQGSHARLPQKPLSG